MSASLKHILLSYEEYERLKHIESEYHKLQSKLQQNLQLQSQPEEKTIVSREGDKSETDDNSSDIQSGSGTSQEQFGTGSQNPIVISSEDEFVNKIAILVSKKIHPRLPESIWNNYNLTSPSTSMITPSNTKPPLPCNNTINKDDENDIDGKNHLLLKIQLFYY
jgi:hypothetical protein